VLLRIKTFRNVRSRVYRPDGDVAMAGWVKKLEQHLVVIRLNAYTSLQVGERLNGECSGDGVSARFEGVVASQAGQDVTVYFTNALTYEPSDTTIRIKAEGVDGKLTEGVNTVDLLVMDISPGGLGGIVERPIGMGVLMDMCILKDAEQIRAKVKVMNCRINQDGCYRAGFTIVQIGRLDEARWTRLIDRMMAA